MTASHGRYLSVDKRLSLVEVYVNDVVVLALILLLTTSGYAAGRMHGQFGYRMGYRYGYRQGYFDGDRASWTRRRRDLQAAVASVLKAPYEVRSDAYPDHLVGTTYTSASQGEAEDEPLEVPASEPVTEDADDPVNAKAGEPGKAKTGGGRPARSGRPERPKVEIASDG